MNLIQCCISFILIKFSQNVDFDYFYGVITNKTVTEEITTLNTIIDKNGRESGEPSNNSSKKMSYTDYMDEEYLPKQPLNFYLRITTPKNLHKTNQNVTLGAATTTETKSVSGETVPDLVHFQYNDYQANTNDKHYKIPKNRTVVSHIKPKIGKFLSKHNTETNQSQEFVNLEPAMESFNLTSMVIGNQTVTWYVPEKFPCWDLPVLYGELGPRNTLRSVFLVNPVKLKNVIDYQELNMFVYEEGLNDFANKWCSEPPCYGDHTLCLFSKKLISPICGDNYSVKTPLESERMTLVNVLNSLRNHVAKGSSPEYPDLPSAANMMQIMYDSELESMSVAWLSQCLPGPAPCSSHRWKSAGQLECTKYAKKCCLAPSDEWPGPNCVPLDDCFIHPIVGCIYTWFQSAGVQIDAVDIECGNIESTTYSTAQLMWASTKKIGCACGYKSNGDIRVVCHFSPGAPFALKTDYFCGLINHKELDDNSRGDVVSLEYLKEVGIDLKKVPQKKYKKNKERIPVEYLPETVYGSWGISSLRRIYEENWLRKQLNLVRNGSKGMVARLVTRYSFVEESESKCDNDAPIYVIGKPASQCLDRGNKYRALCYDYEESHMGYRLIAVLAPVMLLSLIMYDLFSGVMRQATE